MTIGPNMTDIDAALATESDQSAVEWMEKTGITLDTISGLGNTALEVVANKMVEGIPAHKAIYDVALTMFRVGWVCGVQFAERRAP